MTPITLQEFRSQLLQLNEEQLLSGIQFEAEDEELYPGYYNSIKDIVSLNDNDQGRFEIQTFGELLDYLKGGIDEELASQSVLIMISPETREILLGTLKIATEDDILDEGDPYIGFLGIAK